VVTSKDVDVNADTTLPLAPGPSASTCCAPSIGLDASLDVARLSGLAKALSDPLRLQILDVLRRNGEPLCQCELVPLFDVKQPLLSHHINKLVDAGLVDVERRHKWAYYSVRPNALKELTAWLS
jgi:ArsR family transcriptional regulator